MHLAHAKSISFCCTTPAVVAQKRLARGLRLNYPESVALIADATAGIHPRRPLGRGIDGPGPPVPGPPAGDGGRAGDGRTKCRSKAHFPTAPSWSPCIIRSPPSMAICRWPCMAAFCRCRIARCSKSRKQSTVASRASVVTGRGDSLLLNAGRETVSLAVTNLGDRPIQVGSHYHFIETNASCSSTARTPTASGSTFRPAPPSASSRATRRPSRSSISPATASSAAATIWPMAR